MARWQKIVREAARCTRSTLVTVVEPVLSFADMLLRAEPGDRKLDFLGRRRSDEHQACAKREKRHAGAVRYFIVVGPEGGLSRDEVKLAKEAGFVSVSLGRQILKSRKRPLRPFCPLSSMRKAYSVRRGGRKMTTYPYAGFWRRFVAYAIDTFIIFVVFLILTIVAGIAYFTEPWSGDGQISIDELNHPGTSRPDWNAHPVILHFCLSPILLIFRD